MIKVLEQPKPASNDDIIDALLAAIRFVREHQAEEIHIKIKIVDGAYLNIDNFR